MHMRSFAVGLAAVIAVATPAAASKNSFDGSWTVTIKTHAGSCQPTATYPVMVTDGRVSAAGDVSGSVGQGGMVRVSLGGAHANGQLNGNSGTGKWNSATTGMACSGRWEAVRN